MKPPRLLFTLLGLLILALAPSCGTGGLTGSFTYRDPQSGAKAGLIFEPGAPPKATIKVPIYDKDSGELVGMADLAGEIPVSASK